MKFESLLDLALKPSAPRQIGNVPEGLDARLVAGLAARWRGTTLAIARDEQRAFGLAQSARFFAPRLECHVFPAWDSLPYDRISPSSASSAQRCATLARLAGEGARAPLLIIATASAVVQRVPPRAAIKAGAFAAIKKGRIDPAALLAYLEANGYVRASIVREPGEYAFRGGIFDLFAPDRADPLRLDFFGDVLESIKTFDSETQRSKSEIPAIILSPVSEILFTDDSVSHFRRHYVGAFGPPDASDAIFEAARNRIRRQGVEQYLPLFYEKLETIFDYVGKDALILPESLAFPAMDERLLMARDHYEARLAAARGQTGAAGKGKPRVLAPDALWLGETEAHEILAARGAIRFGPFDAPDSLSVEGKPGRNFAAERVESDGGLFNAVRDFLNAARASARIVVLAGWSEGSADRMKSMLAEHGFSDLVPVADFHAAATLPKGKVGLAILPLEQGFDSADLLVLTEADILGERLARPRRKRRSANIISEMAALNQGDFVVHIDHGIARYEGLRTLDIQDAPHDCLELAYAGGDRLYLPVENIDLITRYGGDHAEAQLDRMGGIAWQNRKAKAKRKLLEMAESLIGIAAQRALRESDPLAAPAGTFEEFCARFPYVETDDQLSAIEDVLGDLASGRPMDRLICGDVGFGKTEVALRAAFIVAMTGRQVAVVAPTTLLVRQHFRTFSERFASWPIRVRQLSRLVNVKEAAKTKEMLREGSAEIVVGTHAVLGKEVGFRDLGLVIVDEEQHFGVKHKERLKELRAEVHVLTLSATPIPRTLQLALSGIRDLSIIASPPVDRLAVRTFIAEHDPVTIREALLRERYRGGQSFFVAPRISDLADIEALLTREAPEVRFVSAHGQMPPTQLEDIMTAFYDGQFDVLVSTSIVESGLDIPRANTLIVHNADMFGLAQLYQLRGRVGRSKQRAYAYFLTPAGRTLSEGAAKRLKILQSLDSLGAGFQLASHDLDLRGGGNLLGDEQSGHIREVGAELYQQMLEEAVASLRASQAADAAAFTAGRREWSPQINVGASVLIPESYVSDLNLRMSLYRRLAGLEGDTERQAFAAELVDRFGPLPAETEQLIAIAAVKELCKKANIAKLDSGAKGALASFRPEGFPDPAVLVRLVMASRGRLRLRPDEKLVMSGEFAKPVERLKFVRETLEGLTAGFSKVAA